MKSDSPVLGIGALISLPLNDTGKGGSDALRSMRPDPFSEEGVSLPGEGGTPPFVFPFPFVPVGVTGVLCCSSLILPVARKGSVLMRSLPSDRGGYSERL